MADKDPTPAEMRDRLWKEVDEARIVMLGLVGGRAHHLQPMAAFGDKDGDAIWFYTRSDSDLVKAVGAGHQATVCVMAKDMEFQACLLGDLVENKDRTTIDRYWSPFVSAWFPEGKDDPKLTMLRLNPTDARVWISNKGPISYPLEIAKANLTGKTPDVGAVGDVKP